MGGMSRVISDAHAMLRQPLTGNDRVKQETIPSHPTIRQSTSVLPTFPAITAFAPAAVG